jgi:hypothetical protein
MRAFFTRHPATAWTIVAGAILLVGSEIMAAAIVSGVIAGVVTRQIDKT